MLLARLPLATIAFNRVRTSAKNAGSLRELGRTKFRESCGAVHTTAGVRTGISFAQGIELHIVARWTDPIVKVTAMSDTTDPNAIERSKVWWPPFRLGVCFGHIVRWWYPVLLALATLPVVIVTLAAYEFQARITEMEARFQTRIAEIAGKSDDAGASATAKLASDPAELAGEVEANDIDPSASGKAELASELRALKANYRLFRRYADDRLAIYLDAERRVSDQLRPELYAQIRTERHKHCPWLQPLSQREPPAADIDSDLAFAPVVNQSVMAGGPPVPPFAPSAAENAALTSAIAAYLEYLNYERLVYELVPNREKNPELFALYQDMVYFDNLQAITLGAIDPVTLAIMPPWMLTLIVTLAMGALGSCLHVVRSSLDENCDDRKEYHPMSWFLLRPLLGVGTAFLVFVFLKAGLALTEGNLTEGSLNPFFIAFIAALSGLMSWQALDRIQRWGEQYLGEEEVSKGRWAYGLKGAFEIKPEKTPDALAAFLQEKKELIELWTAEQQRVPESVQGKIADWLGVDRRHLFSDEK
jgi:hypothetical protein